jgi:glycogen debranching enzyme
MNEVIRFADRWYILATSPYGDDRTRVLKQDTTFGVFDRHGDVLPLGLGEQGLFHDGTRFLSRFALTVNGRRPLLLSSTVVETNDFLVVDLTNPDLVLDDDPDAADRPVSPRGSIHLLRSKFLWQGVLYERWRLVNHLTEKLDVRLQLAFEADFADIFEVRGMARPKRGEALPSAVDGDQVTLGYRGRDSRVRRTILRFSPSPHRLQTDHASFRFSLAPRTAVEQHIAISSETDERARTVIGWTKAAEANGVAHERRQREICRVFTANEQFNDWVNRSVADLGMLVLDTPEGPYPAAGVPWYATVFGRDGLLTAYQCLWQWPELSRGVLGHLAATQASTSDAARDAEPGKILHESRGGEMAGLGEIPFGQYYGSVDSTPLFIVLAGKYLERTGDLAFARTLWPHIERALRWIDQHGDVDGDGFVEYIRRTDGGLSNQGWKDSSDSVMHADGTLATAPIALCEVQGYVFAAKRAAAVMARALGDPKRASLLDADADALAKTFDQAFWSESLGTYALALDGEKRPCEVRSSNAGHCLWSGIARPDRAARVAKALLADDMFSAWGIRTLGSEEARFNPMSYHNGSVWPHDNAIIAAGLAAYGHRAAAARVAGALFDASLFVDAHRLPELICGFPRRRGEGPTLYPVACSPQAWAATAVSLLLQSFLGLELDATREEVRFARPVLPPFLPFVELHGLRLGDSSLDLRLERHADDVTMRILRREGPASIVVIR